MLPRLMLKMPYQLREFDLLTFLPLLSQFWGHRSTTALYSYYSVQINTINA